MRLLNVLNVGVIFHGMLCLTSVAQTIITRDQEDIFEIPHEMCWNDTENHCNNMGGKQLKDDMNNKVPCTCQCNYNNINNVFGWFDNQWKCGSNSAIRALVKKGNFFTVFSLCCTINQIFYKLFSPKVTFIFLKFVSYENARRLL